MTKNAKNDKIIYIISISGCVTMKFIIKRTLPVFLSLFAVIFLFSGTSVDATLNGNSEKLSYEATRQTLTYSYDNTTSFTFIKDQN